MQRNELNKFIYYLGSVDLAEHGATIIVHYLTFNGEPCAVSMLVVLSCGKLVANNRPQDGTFL